MGREHKTIPTYQSRELPISWCVDFAIRRQREWHWTHYSPKEQAIILERVRRIVEERPQSYLARHWQSIYGEMIK